MHARRDEIGDEAGQHIGLDTAVAVDGRDQVGEDAVERG
jgi:hypothetical protein